MAALQQKIKAVGNTTYHRVGFDFINPMPCPILSGNSTWNEVTGSRIMTKSPEC